MSPTYADLTSTGLIRRIADHMCSRTQTKPQWAETCGAVIVATCAGDGIVCTTQKGALQPNIFGLCIGGTGISDKSVSIEITKDIMRAFMEQAKIKDLLLPEKFSIEGLSKHLQTHRQGLIAGDEYSGIFSAKGKSWFADSMEFLSKIYDGYIPSYVTIARGIEAVPSVNVNFISASTTYLARLMKDDSFFLQGTGNRFLWSLDMEKEKLGQDDAEAAAFFLSTAGIKEQHEEIAKIAGALVEMNKKTTALVDLHDGEFSMLLELDSSGILGSFKRDIYNRSVDLFNNNPIDPDSGYLSRLAENAIKLATCHRLGRSWEEFDKPSIEKEDTEWALGKVLHHWEEYKVLNVLRDRFVSERATKSYLKDYQKVVDCIDAKGGKANRTQIMQRTGMKVKDAIEVLDTMIQMETIKTIPSPPNQPGRKTVYYTRAEYPTT